MTVRYVVFFACVVTCAVAHLAILVAVARRPWRAADPGVPQPRRKIEILWALLPALALAVVLTATWARVRDRPPEPPVLMEVAR